jgi:methylase of polypeptide subunit release factors
MREQLPASAVGHGENADYPGPMSASLDQVSDTREPLASALEQAIDAGDVDAWLLALGDPLADPLAAIFGSGALERQLMDAAGYGNLTEWLSHAEEWCGEQYKDPRAPDDALVRVLYGTWQHLKDSLVQALIAARRGAEFPERGGVLCFVAGLKLCLVVEFEFHLAAPSVTPLAVVEEPKSAFAIWSSVDNQSPARRDALRKMLVSGHKLIFHRGVLIHVDRRTDSTVFGPSIDTIVMAEILADELCRTKLEAKDLPGSFIEIGTGSGMLLAGALGALPDAERLVGVELNFGSVVCTHRNLVAAHGGLDPLEGGRCLLVAGEFEAARLDGGFDLAACNPPYLPALEDAPAAKSGAEDYLRAVGGGRLIEQLLDSLDELLSPSGKLLLMTNNMGIDQVEKAVPAGFLSHRPFGDEGRPVLLELEALYEREAVLRRLIDEGTIIQRGDILEHVLHPIWIVRETA